MTVGIFSAEVICAFILTTVLLNRYGNWKTQNIVVTFAVLIAWYFSLLIIFVLPIDISLVSFEFIIFAKCIYYYHFFFLSFAFCPNYSGPDTLIPHFHLTPASSSHNPTILISLTMTSPSSFLVFLPLLFNYIHLFY